MRQISIDSKISGNCGSTGNTRFLGGVVVESGGRHERSAARGWSRRRLLQIGALWGVGTLLAKSVVSASDDMTQPAVNLSAGEAEEHLFRIVEASQSRCSEHRLRGGGPADGQPVILLHGWPFDIYAFVDVAPLLAKAGFRVIVPYQRGYGSTTLPSADTFRNAQQLDLRRGCRQLNGRPQDQDGNPRRFRYRITDGGRRSIAVARALQSVGARERRDFIANVSANAQPAAPRAEYAFWYQYYFTTKRGELGYTKYTYDFNKLVWSLQSPKWHFDDATFDRTAMSYKNPDHVAIVIHNYRWRIGLAPGDPKYDTLESKLFAGPTIGQPAITIGSDFDGANASGASYRSKFTGTYGHRILNGIGHDVPQEAPQEFADAIVAVAKS